MPGIPFNFLQDDKPNLYGFNPNLPFQLAGAGLPRDPGGFKTTTMQNTAGPAPAMQLPQVPPETNQQAEFLSGIGKAFQNFSKAIQTPGFAQTFFGSIGAALGPEGSWQQKLGGVGANLGMRTGQTHALGKLMTGQPLTKYEQSFTSPETVFKLLGAGSDVARTSAYVDLAGAQAGAMAPWQEKLTADLLEKMMERPKAPTVSKVPVGEGVEAGGYFKFNPQTGGYDWVEISRGKTRGLETGTDRDLRLANYDLAKKRFYLSVTKQAHQEAMRDPRVMQYGKLRTDPMTGDVTIDWLDPKKGPEMYQSVLNEKLNQYVVNPNMALPETFAAPMEEQKKRKADWPE